MFCLRVTRFTSTEGVSMGIFNRFYLAGLFSCKGNVIPYETQSSLLAKLFSSHRWLQNQTK